MGHMGSRCGGMGSAFQGGGAVTRLTAVNVGIPKDVPWHGKTVYTGVYKQTVAGPRMVSPCWAAVFLPEEPVRLGRMLLWQPPGAVAGEDVLPRA